MLSHGVSRRELLRRVGSVQQIGGIRDFTFNDGRAKGMRAIEINTGFLRLTVLPDRCMDVADASYRGMPLAWLSKSGLAAPAFYEKEGTGWLRGFFGGLITTCGLKNIGRATKEQGLHGRIANTPASNVSVYADWEGDEYVMRVSGEMRESAVFGDNLVLKRTISTRLLSRQVSVDDVVVNESFEDAPITLGYHCNFGFPLIDENARIVGVPEEYAALTPPVHGKNEECIPVFFSQDTPSVGIENGDTGVYLSWNRAALPDFLIWKMLGESEYVVGLEPRTTRLGGDSIAESNAFIVLRPFEEHRVHMDFEIKDL